MMPKREDIDQAIKGRNFDFPKGQYDPRVDKEEPVDPENTPEPFGDEPTDQNTVQSRLLILGKQADEVMGLVIGIEDRLNCCLAPFRDSEPKSDGGPKNAVKRVSDLEHAVELIGQRLTEAANRLREVTGAIRL